MPRQDTSKDTRALGPGAGGAEDFIAVRLNSMALVVLFAWLLTALVLLLPDLSHAKVTAWLRHPLNAIMMILLIGMSFWHVKYGLDELIDDYVRAPLNRALAISANYAVTGIGALAGIWSVMRVALGPNA
jgi:succinate dehydrogenase / fumarate reductase membrane anchor subunit